MMELNIEQPKVEATQLETIYGKFDFFCFSWGTHEEDNVLCLKSHEVPTNPLVRVQSACYTAEIFRSKDCDCHEQLHTSQEMIAKDGGVLIYMLCDGRGAGLLAKVRGLELGRTQGLNTSEAYSHMRLDQDPREYSRVAWILHHFEISSIRLLTNNPRKVLGLEKLGTAVERLSLEIPATEHSRPYLATKRDFMGHLLSEI